MCQDSGEQSRALGPLVSQSTYLKNSLRNTIRVSNSFDPDQDQQNVGPDLGPNCLQKLAADDTSKQRVKNFANLNLSYFFLNASLILDLRIICILLNHSFPFAGDGSSPQDWSEESC